MLNISAHSESESLYFVRRTSRHEITNFRTPKGLDFRFDLRTPTAILQTSLILEG